MNLTLLFTLCFHMADALVLQRDNATWLNSYTINPQMIVGKMQANSHDAQVQIQACHDLDGSFKSPIAQLNSGPILKAMADAVVNNVDNAEVFVTCSGAIVSNIVFDFFQTTLLHVMSPNLTTALISGLRKYKDNPQVLSRTLEHIAGMHSMPSSRLYTQNIALLGGFDVLHEAVEKWSTDGAVQMSAWRGFSDHAHTELGAAIIANMGGPLKGITWLMQKLRDHPEAHYGMSADTLDCHYEILQVVNGLLDVDYLNIYGPELLRVGLLDLLHHAMEVDFDLRASQSTCCEVMSRLLLRNPGLKLKLAHGPHAVVDKIADTIQRFRNDDPTPWGQSTLGKNYPVIPQCALVLEQIALDRKGKRAIQKTNMSGILNAVRPDMTLAVLPLKLMLAMP